MKADDPNSSTEAVYGPENVQVYRNSEHIRRRPGMYIGDTGTFGFHNLLWELVSNGIDEFRAGFATTVEVKLDRDGYAIVEDDGRGIPVEPVKSGGISLLTLLCTQLVMRSPFGPKFGKIAAGLRAIGLCTVTALSEAVEIEVARGGTLFRQQFSRGEITSPLIRLGSTKKTGTRIRFKPDGQLFTCTGFDWELISQRLRELASLHAGLSIKLSDARSDAAEKFHAPDGLAGCVQYLNRDLKPLHPVIRFQNQEGNVQIELALQYTRQAREQCLSFVNGSQTLQGSHVIGYRAGLTRSINELKRTTKDEAARNRFTSKQTRQGLTAVISVSMAQPNFVGATRAKLNNPEVASAVSNATYQFLKEHWQANPKEATAILRWLS